MQGSTDSSLRFSAEPSAPSAEAPDWSDELSPGEQVLWSDVPRRGIRLQWFDLIFVPFGLIFMSVPLIGVGLAIWDGNGEPFMLLFILPFVLAGFYISFGRLLIDAWKRARTAYALTPERLIIRSGLWQRQIKSIYLHNLDELTFVEHRNGGGRITVGKVPWLFAMHAAHDPFGMVGDVVPTLELSRDARAVYQLIRTAQRARMSVPTSNTNPH